MEGSVAGHLKPAKPQITKQTPQVQVVESQSIWQPREVGEIRWQPPSIPLVESQQLWLPPLSPSAVDGFQYACVPAHLTSTMNHRLLIDGIARTESAQMVHDIAVEPQLVHQSTKPKLSLLLEPWSPPTGIVRSMTKECGRQEARRSYSRSRSPMKEKSRNDHIRYRDSICSDRSDCR